MATEVEPPPGLDQIPEATENSEEGALCEEAEKAESPEPNPDLEDGEIDDDEEEEEDKDLRVPKGDCNHNEGDAGEVSDHPPRGERRHSPRGGSSDPDGGDGSGPAGASRRPRESRHQRKHKSDKSGRRDRNKRSLKDELRSDEEKKRLIKEKLRALELQMGGDPDQEEDEDDLDLEDGYDEEDPEVYHEEQSPPRRHRASRKRRAASDEADHESFELDPSDSKRGRTKNDKRGHPSDAKEKRHKSKDICQLYMQGKCPRNANQCHYSHDAVPPQIMELCKFYLFERCAKKDKCLYLHKGFPCKYYHTGLRCMDTAESCKFSHEPLNDITRKILLKHLETAPNEILGDFPRYNRESALAVVFQTEAKHKGWNEDDDHSQHSKKPSRSAGDNMIANSNQSDHLFPVGPQNGSDDNEGKKRVSRWDKPSPSGFRPSLPPPKALMGTANVFGHNNGKGLLGPRPGSLLGQPPLLSLNLNPPALAPQRQAFPPGYGEDQLSEEQIANFLKTQKTLSQINPKVFNHQHQQASSPDQNEMNRDFREEGSAKTSMKEDLMDSTSFAEPPKPQQRLFDRLNQGHEEAEPLIADESRSTNMNSLIDKHGFNHDEREDSSFGQTGDDDWYSSDDDEKAKRSIDHQGQKARTSPRDFLLPRELTAVLSSIKKDVKPDTYLDSNLMEDSQNRRDPRRNRDPRVGKAPQMENKEPSSSRIPTTSSFKSEIDKDQKILEMDLSIFGDLELPTFKDPEPEEEPDPEQERLGLPFKPHRVHPAAKEIDASIHAHPPFEYKLIAITILKPDYSSLAASSPISRVHQDPRLRRYAKKRPVATDPVESVSPSNYQQQTLEPLAKVDRPSDPRRKNPPHTVTTHFEPLAAYNPKNDLHAASTSDFQRQPTNNFDTSFPKRRGGPPLDDVSYRPQDGQRQQDDWGHKDNSIGQWGSGRGNHGHQDQWSDPRSNQEHIYGGVNHGSQPYNRSFNSYPQGRGSGMGPRGAGGGPPRNVDPRLQRDPRYQKC